LLHCKITKACTPLSPFSPPEQMPEGRPLDEDGLFFSPSTSLHAAGCLLFLFTNSEILFLTG